MRRLAKKARGIAPRWGWVVATCLVGVAVVFGLGTVLPAAMESSVVGVAVRTAVCALCLAGFVAVGGSD